MENDETDVIFGLGQYGQEILDGEPLISGHVRCIKSPDSFSFMGDRVYRVDGSGGLVYDEDEGVYRIGFGDDSTYGYCLSWDMESVNDGGEMTWREFSEYIPHDILIRHFLYEPDCYYNPELVEIVKRQINIDKVLE